jgi:uncharacterized membrane protein
VPGGWTIEAVIALGMFAATYALDQASYNGHMALPSWLLSGTVDAARQILTTVAAADPCRGWGAATRFQTAPWQ